MTRKLLGLLLCFLSISLFTCREKSFEEYDESEFYKSQGIILSARQTKTILDDPFMKEIKYEYFVNDSTILRNSENFSFIDMTRGVPIEVLVHKKNPKISFYWRNGLSDSITPYQLDYIRKKMDTIMVEFENLK
ncbi:hypothetical protein [Euzebyella saccharophila]|uniref:DUF4136 domain-containing protein n=1 Tax=Euzebyella saccharophila TaxID=679664 RepID=A0ABV8JUH0_9FLAO|nr:hypothetical protein [Euzebyella saccharophila]